MLALPSRRAARNLVSNVERLEPQASSFVESSPAVGIIEGFAMSKADSEESEHIMILVRRIMCFELPYYGNSSS